jgi:hypothetical protein
MEEKESIKLPSTTELVYLILGLTFIKHNLSCIARADVYSGFKKLRDEFPEYFQDFYFTVKGGQYYARELEDVLSHLGNMFNCSSPTFSGMSFHSGALKIVEEKFVEWIPDKKMRVFVEKMAQKFFEGIGKA